MPQKHLISFFSTNTPKLDFWEGNEEAELELKGKMKIEFDGMKKCTGFKGREKRHPCPHRYEGKEQCPICSARDISRVYTCHDFTGYEDLQEEFQEHEFSIYLVSFGDYVKCGLSHSERIKDRVREQGADYYAEIMRLKGAEAYQMERLLQDHFGFKNAIRSETKLKLLGKESPEFLEKAIVKVESAAPFNEYILGTPMPEKIEYKMLKNAERADEIKGEIVGAKGPLLFFKGEEGNKVINMKPRSGMGFEMEKL